MLPVLPLAPAFVWVLQTSKACHTSVAAVPNPHSTFPQRVYLHSTLWPWRTRPQAISALQPWSRGSLQARPAGMCRPPAMPREVPQMVQTSPAQNVGGDTAVM